MAKTKSKNKVETSKVTGAELTWYIIAGVFCLTGIVLAVLSIVGDYIGTGNPIREAEASMVNIFKWNVSWRFYGLVLFLIGAIILVITLYVGSKREVRVTNRESTHSNRVEINMDAIAKANKTSEGNQAEVQETK